MAKKRAAAAHPSGVELDRLFELADRDWEAGRLKSAFRLFRAAAKAGDTSSQINLGNFYDEGIGVKPNRRLALYWYRRAYRSGERCGASNIAMLYLKDGKRDAATKWFERAVKLGDGDASLELAKLYIQKGSRSKAIGYLERVLRCEPMDVTASAVEEARGLIRDLRQRRS